MSKDIREMRDEIKAPKRLVEAAKKGERVAPRRKTDTHATHVRRFTKAFAVYACAALVLIGGSLTLPALLSEPETPLSQPPEETVDPHAFVRPDLVWADETNKLSAAVVYSMFEEHEVETGECYAGRQIDLPAYPDDTVFAVKAYAQRWFDAIVGANDTLPVAPAAITTYLIETEGWEYFVGPDGDLCFAVTKAQIEAIDTDALSNALAEGFGIDISYEVVGDENVPHHYRGGEFSLVIAWQSPTDADPIEPEIPSNWDLIECH